ncbi:MAG: hypothetical protein LBM59_07695 [Ruminococcus sp.]|jgi:hypothetical protein|nr:hypothetical protein [Ruminococcus sp.]
MTKEDLIKKAAARGITLTETEAEKYLNLSDEELENIAGGGPDYCLEKCSQGITEAKFWKTSTCTNCPNIKDVSGVHTCAEKGWEHDPQLRTF